jgi:predicted phosphodiesterase
MQIALISDIHGNYTALEAALADIDRRHVDAIICLGDVATIGPQPRQVLDKLKELGCPCILGNHESALLEPERAGEFQIAPSLLPTLEWCIRQLTPDDFDFLRSFKPDLTVELDKDKSLHCFHGSPESNTSLILATTSAKELDRIFANDAAIIMAGGHSHIQMLRQFKGKLIINPGSVGNAFLEAFTAGTTPTVLPWAEYAIVNWDNGNLSVDLHRISFDIKLFGKILSASGDPLQKGWYEK